MGKGCPRTMASPLAHIMGLFPDVNSTLTIGYRFSILFSLATLYLSGIVSWVDLMYFSRGGPLREAIHALWHDSSRKAGVSVGDMDRTAVISVGLR